MYNEYLEFCKDKEIKPQNADSLKLFFEQKTA